MKSYKSLVYLTAVLWVIFFVLLFVAVITPKPFPISFQANAATAWPPVFLLAILSSVFVSTVQLKRTQSGNKTDDEELEAGI